jgi:hypothetical protein
MIPSDSLIVFDKLAINALRVIGVIIKIFKKSDEIYSIMPYYASRQQLLAHMLKKWNFFLRKSFKR